MSKEISILSSELLPWIPTYRFIGIEFSDPGYISVCGALCVLVLLVASKTWCRWTCSPIIFTVVYSLCFLLVGFDNSLGDSVQWKESINKRYYMSEPGATWIHHWAYYYLHSYFNIGVQSAIGWTSRIAGVVYLYAVAKVSLMLFSIERVKSIALFRMTFISAGFFLLFFGYIENTPLAVPFELYVIFFSIKIIRNPKWKSIAAGSFFLAAAMFIHGRVSFTAPAFALACILPSGPILCRLIRSIGGTLMVTSYLALALGSILIFDKQNIIGGLYGNITGGGNRQMFVPLSTFLSYAHWKELSSTFLIGAGFLFPLGIFGALWRALLKKDLLYIWLLGYMATDLAYLSLWEFDFGYFIDWDLIFSGMVPFVLATALVFANATTPAILSVIPLAITTVITLGFGMLVNGEAFTINTAKVAKNSYDENVCKTAGLERTFYSDSELSSVISPAVADVPNHRWGQHDLPHPNRGQPLGARYRGFIHISSEGQRRIFLEATGNVHLEVGDAVLLHRWSSFEWRVTSEREVYFPKKGWYPIAIEFYTRVQNIPLRLSVESLGTPQHAVTDKELCF